MGHNPEVCRVAEWTLWSFAPARSVEVLHQLKTFSGCFIQKDIGTLHNDFYSHNIGICLVTIGRSFCLILGASKARL